MHILPPILKPQNLIAENWLKLITRTGFKLYEPEAELILAKAYLAQGDKEKARIYAQAAYDKAKDMSYQIMKIETSNFLSEIIDI